MYEDNRYIGEFEVESGKLMLSDPCYQTGTWCQHVLHNVKKGMWEVYISKDDVRVVELFAKIKGMDDWKNIHTKEIIGLGVDSGQFGFFDEQHYRNDEDFDQPSKFITEEKSAGDRWYGHCCDTTKEKDAGVIPYGCLSASGYGDGEYAAIIYRNQQGFAVGVKVEFICEIDDEDEEDEE